MDPIELLSDEELDALEETFHDLLEEFSGSRQAQYWLAEKGLELVYERHHRQQALEFLDAQLDDGSSR